MNAIAAKKKMFQEMGEFADGESQNELRAKYAPVPKAEENGGEPPSEPVPGAEDEEGAPLGAETAREEDIEALLAQLTPEQLESLLAQLQ